MNAPQILDIYDRLTQAADDRARARVIAEAFAQLEERYPHLPELATRTHLSETELKLIKEIEQVRSELKQTELKLTQEIDKVRLEIEQVRGEVKALEVRLIQAIHRQTVWVILAIGGVTGFVRWLDVLMR